MKQHDGCNSRFLYIALRLW